MTYIGKKRRTIRRPIPQPIKVPEPAIEAPDWPRPTPAPEPIEAPDWPTIKEPAKTPDQP